jgi:ketosteroid isomerase-like protein
MRNIMLSVVATALAATAAGALAAAASPGDELLQLEANWSKAMVAGDYATVDKIIAPDWVGQNHTGKSTNKAEFMALLKEGKVKMSAMKNHDVHVRMFGEMAVVQGSDDEKSMESGKDSSGSYTWTDVFQHRDGRWVAVASQVTKVGP